jgi:excisionase family DNA binding protein
MPLLTVSEVANELHVGRSTLYRHMRSKHPIRYIKLGGKTLFRKRDVDMFIEDRIVLRRLEKV